MNAPATTTPNQSASASNQLALIKKNVVDVVVGKVRQFQENGELHFPANYSPDNALKAAFLVLQNTQTRDKQPVLTACTQNSIANSLLDMVIQGLNPVKKQCYFIAYGKNLACQRSYFGNMAMAKEIAGAKDVYAQVVYKGDEFVYEIKRGNKQVVTHTQKIENISAENILAAYCVIELPNGEQFTDIMTMEQIKQAWKQSSNKPFENGENLKGDSVHAKFTEEMTKKTVINRACKKYINSSSDNALVKKAMQRSEEVADEAGFEAEVEENANGEIIDIETGEVMDASSQDDPTPTPEQPKTASAGPSF